MKNLTVRINYGPGMRFESASDIIEHLGEDARAYSHDDLFSPDISYITLNIIELRNKCKDEEEYHSYSKILDILDELRRN